ncbi:hypothetical protein BaRGS_00030473 [Batillaria attramentaria]|uniref:Secreted protein n=1 Tax=Batillaria attramentaria TaxID=370345 RepID=A0ABD0JU23_9CAEN
MTMRSCLAVSQNLTFAATTRIVVSQTLPAFVATWSGNDTLHRTILLCLYSRQTTCHCPDRQYELKNDLATENSSASGSSEY